MTEVACPKCGYVALYQHKLQEQLEEKNKSDQEVHHCRFGPGIRSINTHRDLWEGNPVNKPESTEENDNLKTVLSATKNQGTPDVTSRVLSNNINSHDLTHNGNGNIIGHDQINHITNNIFVSDVRHGDIDNIRNMPMHELKGQIGCQSAISTDVIRASQLSYQEVRDLHGLKLKVANKTLEIEELRLKQLEFQYNMLLAQKQEDAS